MSAFDSSLAKKIAAIREAIIGRARRKIFCIGFNKTGTTSLHNYFLSLGLTSTHNTFWPIHSRAKVINKSLFRHQCYSDGEQADFIALDTAFPGSLFILNNRNERDWLYSRLKHVMRYNENVSAPDILDNKKYGWMARDFFFNEKLAMRKWICERRIYIAQAMQYFDGRPNFIEIDITAATQWQSQLFAFLTHNAFAVKNLSPANGESLHKNKRGFSWIRDQSLLSTYKEEADRILSEVDQS